MISGGSTRAASAPTGRGSSVGLERARRCAACGRRDDIGAARPATAHGGAASALSSGMFIDVFSVASREPAALRRGPHWSQTVDALDRQALEVGLRIVRIEHLAVEEGLLAARGVAGMSAAATPSALAASRQRSSRLTLSTSALMSVVGSNLPQRMSSVTNQASWLLNG